MDFLEFSDVSAEIKGSMVTIGNDLLVHGACVCFSEVVLFTDMVDSKIQ